MKKSSPSAQEKGKRIFFYGCKESQDDNTNMMEMLIKALSDSSIEIYALDMDNHIRCNFSQHDKYKNMIFNKKIMKVLTKKFKKTF